MIANTEPSTDAIVGYLVYRLLPDSLEVLDLRIDPNHRRNGYARGLILHLINEAQVIQKDMLCLDVSELNAPAQTLYQSLGFRIVGRRNRYYSDGSDALLMDLMVPP